MGKETATAQTSTTPKTAQAISLILQSMGVDDAEPRVVHQLLDLAFRKMISHLNQCLLAL
jgi:hypothetical protein